MQRTRTTGGTDVHDFKYMQLKRLLKSRGVDEKELHQCPSIDHLRLLGKSTGVLTDANELTMDVSTVAFVVAGARLKHFDIPFDQDGGRSGSGHCAY